MIYTENQIEKWQREGISETLISKWIANANILENGGNSLAFRAQRFTAKVRGVAFGTADDVAVNVIETQAHMVKQCDVCGGQQIVVNREGRTVPCKACGADKRLMQERNASLAKYSSDSARARTSMFANFITADKHADLILAKTAAQRFARNPHGWTVIYGNTGNGKSHLCAAAWNELREREVCIYISAPDMLSSLQRLFNGEVAKAEGETFDERLDKYKRVSVLLIDDIGAERTTEWTDATWFTLFDFRYREKLPTMITTNLDPYSNSFAFRLGSRIRDEHDGFSFIVKNTAGDYRTSP